MYGSVGCAGLYVRMMVWENRIVLYVGTYRRG
jgi:hypothetical protein